MIERQELHCHNCGRYVQFDIDTELNGNHVLKCPNCGHEHCRVVKDGKITDIRWDSRNLTHYVNTYTMTSTTSSTYNNYISVSSSSNMYLYSSWMTATTTV